MFSASGHMFVNYDRDVGYECKEKSIMVTNAGYLKVNTKTINVNRKKGRIDYQILYIVDGSISFIEKDGIKKAGKGTIKIYKPNEPQIYTSTETEPAEMYWIHFTGYDSLKLLQDCSVCTCSIGVYRDIIMKFKECIEELQVKRKNFDVYTNGLLISLIADIGRRSESNYNIDLPIEKVIKSINTIYDRKWNIKELADMCHLSEYRFMHKFKEQTGYSPMQYCTMVKMERAKTMLLETTMTITEVAEMLGYTSPLYFSRVFKIYSNQSPSEFRKY